MTDRLSLIATDKEDLCIVSVFLQDAILYLKDMQYLVDEKKFVMLVNRFRWENQAREDMGRTEATYERIHSGICVDGVQAVASRKFDLKKWDSFLEVLAMMQPDPSHLEICFAGGAAIRLTIDRMALYMQDLDESWPTPSQPLHKAAKE